MNILQIEIESVRVLLGVYGNAEIREKNLDALGETYGEPDCRTKIQNCVNQMVRNPEAMGDALADYVLAGEAGSGDDRIAHLGERYKTAQERVNEILSLRGLSDAHVRAVLVNKGFGTDESVQELRLKACGYDPSVFMIKPSKQDPAAEPKPQQVKSPSSVGCFKLFFINHERYTWKDNWGDNCLVESDGKFLLMDSCMPAAKDAILNFLKARKVNKLSLYVSHPHYDHYGNMMALMNDKYFTIEHMYLCKYGQISGIDDSNVRMHYNNIKKIGEHAKSHGIPITWLSKGVCFTVGSARFDILYDLPLNMSFLQKGGNRILNNLSPICMVTLGKVKYLTCGDAFTDVENTVLDQKIDVRAEVLKLSHHGGNEANSLRWLKAVSPKYVVYNNGEGGGLGSAGWTRQAFDNAHKAGAGVYNPTYHGNVVFTITGPDIDVWTERHREIH